MNSGSRKVLALDAPLRSCHIPELMENANRNHGLASDITDQIAARTVCNAEPRYLGTQSP